MAALVTVVATHDLAKGVLAGVLLSGIFFAGKVARMFRVTSALGDDGVTRIYRVEGQIFFASAESFIGAFDFAEALARVLIDVSAAHLWDITSIGALDKVVLKFRKYGVTVEIEGLNEASAHMMERFALHDKEHASFSAAH